MQFEDETSSAYTGWGYYKEAILELKDRLCTCLAHDLLDSMDGMCQCTCAAATKALHAYDHEVAASKLRCHPLEFCLYPTLLAQRHATAYIW